jgi:site-specific DNA recombinase
MNRPPASVTKPIKEETTREAQRSAQADRGLSRDKIDGSAPAKNAVIYLRVSTAKQAGSGGEPEGYSIPAQRSACHRKAEELGASVVSEYVDAGASARSADRPALQELLDRLEDEQDVDYVIVHKVDRLARNRADDVAIGLTIHQSGAVLVSASEQIDDTPAGTLLHGIMATIAEFYSHNLSHEAKKGLHQKAKRGGTPGYAPLGYLNSREHVDSREVKTVILDPDRAPHLQWAFEAYASGDWSIGDLVEELARRGMKTRPTATRRPVPLSRSQVHRILSSSYYVGRLPYGGVEYEGNHPPLIDPATWHQVQDVLEARRISGDRSWRHEHYLKGTLFCGKCESRLGFGYSKGKGGTYAYFFCLGHAKKRTDCDMPYLPAELMEEHMLRHWQKQKLAPQLIEMIRSAVSEEIAETKKTNEKLLFNQKRRLQKLERTRQKLIDAYLVEAIPVADLKQRQEALAVEQREAGRLIELASADVEIAEQRLEIALGLLEKCDRLYVGADEMVRRDLNQAFYSGLFVNKEGIVRAELNPPFAQLADCSIGWVEEQEPGDEADSREPEPDPSPEPQGGTNAAQNGPRAPRGAKEAKDPAKPMAAAQSQNPATAGSRGSNVELMAERAGFEPATHLSAGTRFPVALLRPTRTPLRARKR